MSEPLVQVNPEEWICSLCGTPLSMGKVRMAYLGNEFPVDLPRCNTCGMVYVPEELALGKMDEVERSLEDK